MSVDRLILAVVESKPVTASAVGGTLSVWSLIEQGMRGGTTIFSFLAAVGGFVLFLYNLRAVRRKRRLKANLPCMRCGYDGPTKR